MSTPIALRRAARAAPTSSVLALFSALCVALPFAAPVRGQCPPGGLSGAISTCAEDGAQLPGDAFAQGCDVYLRAAPGSAPATKLPPGDYVFQVTDPAGTTLLSQEGPLNGVITIATGQAGFSSYAGGHLTSGDGAAGELRVQLCPFGATPNPGGVCKVWITPRDCYAAGKGTFGFVSSKSKTHTFKVTGAPPSATAALVIRRYCDRDADGDETGEWLQDGVRYMVAVSSIDAGQPFELVTGTDGSGTVRLDGIPAPATYTVCELVPGTSTAGCWWWGTQPAYAVTAGAPAPACGSGTLDGDDVATLTFGAACVCQAEDGVERRFFLGRSGKALLAAHDPQWRDALSRAGLVTHDGSPYTVPSGTFRQAYASLAAWLQSDGSSNTAYALSTEAAAALLAANVGKLDLSKVRVLRPEGVACLGTNALSPADMLEQARAQIASDGFTPAGDPNAELQDCLLRVLSGVNTRALPLVNGHCCEAVYP